MSIFEFLSVSVAIVLALALGKLIGATIDVFNKERRDFLHYGFCLAAFVGVTVIWWSQWRMVSKESWHYGEFLLLLGVPISSYLAAHVLVSNDSSRVSSWRSHFVLVHRWFFAALGAQVVLATLRRVYIDGAVMNLAPVITLLILAIGLFSTKRMGAHRNSAVLECPYCIFSVSSARDPASLNDRSWPGLSVVLIESGAAFINAEP